MSIVFLLPDDTNFFAQARALDARANKAEEAGNKEEAENLRHEAERLYDMAAEQRAGVDY